MSQTLSNIHAYIINSAIMKQAYEQVSELSKEDKWTNFEFLEAWLRDHREPLSHFQELLTQVILQLGEEQVIEVNRKMDAVLFCAAESLFNYLGFAEDLVRKHFPTVREINLSLECDPETSDKWVSLVAEISGEIDQVIEWEDNFVKEWVASVPYPEREKIRFSCDIL